MAAEFFCFACCISGRTKKTSADLLSLRGSAFPDIYAHTTHKQSSRTNPVPT